MFNLPWKIKLERRPRPLPEEFVDLVLMVNQLSELVQEVRKMAEATQRKVYRDADRDDGRQDVSVVPTVQENIEWRTGDPAL